jgi:hypothetical protein
MTDLTPIFCARALADATGLSAADKADLYDYAAALLASHGFASEAAAASDAASGIRDAEAAQTLFTSLLSRAHKMN